MDGVEQPRRMVVVDDERDILEFVARVFRRQFTVECALSMEEALPLLERGEVAVVITDRHMPHHSGEELLLRAAALQPGAVRILLTGYSDGEAHDRNYHAQLHKPVDADGLRAAVAAAMEQHEG